MLGVLAAQIEHHRPDVILTYCIEEIPIRFWQQMKRHYGILVGQIAAPLSEQADLSCFDLLLSSLPNYVERFRRAGRQSELFRLGFDPLVLDKIGNAPATIDVSFVGSLTRAHEGRVRWLEHLCRQLGVKVWGQGVEQLPSDSAIRKNWQGTAWGADMFRILRQSKMTLNYHIGIAGPYANNMRLYEATGVGTLLITDEKQNLTDMFKPGEEVVTYRNTEECIEQVRHYLDHETKRLQIAAAGHARTLRDHSYEARMQEFVSIVKRYF